MGPQKGAHTFLGERSTGSSSVFTDIDRAIFVDEHCSKDLLRK